MATIVLRAGKGSPLTNAEVDANFSNINDELVLKLPLSGGTLNGDLIFSANKWLYAKDASGGNTRIAGISSTANVAYFGSIDSAAVAELYLRTGGVDRLYIGSSYIDTTIQLRSQGNPVLTAANYNSYAPTLTGTGASGTWGINISGSAGNALLLPTAYIGGQQLNPQTYFNQSTGLRVAMTAAAGVWSDTMWINGYSGSDVLSMCALHFQRNGTPRMYISTQNSTATSYGTLYEVLSAYNYNSYTPTLTGTGASGTWGISVTGSAGSLSDTGAYMVSRGAVADTAIDTATAHGFYAISHTGASSSLLAWNAGGSTGPVQLQVFYPGDARYRNKIDSATWTAWKTLLHDGNYSNYALPLSGGSLTGQLRISATDSMVSFFRPGYYEWTVGQRANGDFVVNTGGNFAGSDLLTISHSGGASFAAKGGFTLNSRTTYYTGSNFEVSTSDNTPPGISFHRAGYSATLLYESDGELYINAWVTRGQNGKLLSSGNVSSYALPVMANGTITEFGQTISSNYTVTSGKNALSAGPITVNDGVTVTVPDGCAWVIV